MIISYRYLSSNDFIQNTINSIKGYVIEFYSIIKKFNFYGYQLENITLFCFTCKPTHMLRFSLSKKT